MSKAQLLEKRTLDNRASDHVTVETPVYRLLRGQRVEHNGEALKVARVIPCYTRRGWHVHLLPLDYEPLPGYEGVEFLPLSPCKDAAEAKARSHEAQHLTKLARPEDGTLPVILEDWELYTDILGVDYLTYGTEPPINSYRVQLRSPATNGDDCPIAVKTLKLLTNLQLWEIPELINRVYRGAWLYCQAWEPEPADEF